MQSTKVGYLITSEPQNPGDISWVCPFEAEGLASGLWSGDKGDESLVRSASSVTGRVDVKRIEDAQSEAKTAASKWSPSTVSSTHGYIEGIGYFELFQIVVYVLTISTLTKV